jgi:hypothetical protein
MFDCTDVKVSNAFEVVFFHWLTGLRSSILMFFFQDSVMYVSY